jgi:acyl-CoA thioesterase-1
MAFKLGLRAFLAAGLLLLSGMIAAAEPYRIVGFGDSLMAGYLLNAGEGFTEKLQTALKAKGHDVEVINAGVSGDTTSGGLSRLDWSVPDGTQLVILELGANDMLRAVAPDIAEKNLDAMLAKLQERKIPVLLAGMLAAPNLGPEYKAAFDAIYPRLATKYHVPLYPFFLDGVAGFPNGVAGDSKLILEDGVHPSARGIDVMVERILPMVEKLIAANPDNS